MSLKLRFVAGSIPSALTKPFQRFTAHRHPFSSDHCGCCYITYFRWLRRSTTALICDVSGWRYRGVQALVLHDFFDQSRIPRPRNRDRGEGVPSVALIGRYPSILLLVPLPLFMSFRLRLT